MNTFSIQDLEQVLKYAKKHLATTVQIEIQELDNRRMIVTILNVDYQGGDAKITVYAAEANKKPTVSLTITLLD